jgi:hypothetical protein
MTRAALARSAGILLALVASRVVLPFGVSNAAETVAKTAPVTGLAAGTLEANRRALFKKMLAAPGNVALALDYASLSAQAGDLEGAVSTLERLLIFAPNLAQLNFELGVLYYRLGAYDVASGYFKTAAAAPDVTPQMQVQIAKYAAGAALETAADRTMGSIMFGARYQSNANGGAASALVDLNGVEFALDSAAMADPDANGFVAGTLHYSHDLASQGDKLDADISVYGSLYGKHDELNTAAIEAEFGPVFNLERFSIAHSTLGIYGIGGAIGLRTDPYLYTAGLGTVLTTNFDPATQGQLRLEYRYEDYINSAIRPTVSDMTGSRTRLTGTLRHQVNAAWMLYGSAYGERKDAVAGDEADWEGGASVGGTVQFKGPIESQQRPWSLDLSAGALQRNFDANDPAISTAPRLDREAFVQGALTVPVGDTWSAIATLGYHRVLSTYDLYTNDNVSTSLALARGF